MMSLLAKWPILFLSYLFLSPYACLGTWGTPTPVLLLGDSYISANGGLDVMLKQLLVSSGDKREVKAITSGGKDFAWHAKQLKVAGSQDEVALGSEGPAWGLVVLQDRSHVPAFCCNGPNTEFGWEFAASLGAVEDLDHAAERRGAKTLLLQTWGRRDGVPESEEPFLNGFEQMNQLVMRGYEMYASKITRSNRKPLTAPVGAAFSLIYNDIEPQEALHTDNLWQQLYSKDGSHPSVAGSYLAACMLYAAITDKSPIGLAGIPGVTAAQVTALQQKAHDASFVNATTVKELKDVEGRYFSDDPEVKGFVAEIAHGVVIWPVGVHTPLKRNGTQLEMRFHGKSLKGSFSNDKITWSDGDVWKRSASKQQTGALAHSENARRGRLARRESVTNALEIVHIEPGGEQFNPHLVLESS